MVGFFNAFELTGDQKYLGLSIAGWDFIKQYLKAPNGEWYWGVYADYSTMNSGDKVGIWKCPYHNGRACIELIKRLSNLEY
jgi:mannobiose 2-epimerase